MITYVNYVAGTKKGDIDKEHLFNNPFELGKVNSATYTSDRVVETFESFTSGTTKVAWHPVVAGSIRALDANGDEVSIK